MSRVVVTASQHNLHLAAIRLDQAASQMLSAVKAPPPGTASETIKAWQEHGHALLDISAQLQGMPSTGAAT